MKGYRKLYCPHCKRTSFVPPEPDPQFSEELSELIRFFSLKTRLEMRKILIQLRRADFQKIRPAIVEQFGEERADAIERAIGVR